MVFNCLLFLEKYIHNITRIMNTTAEPEYVKLRIMLNTNQGKQVELKPDMFAFDNKVSGDGPYVCTNINYSKSTLILLPHQKQVEIFMNELEFKNFCITSRGKKGADTSKDEKVRSTIINNNIGIMLNALFPISFPIQDTVESLCPETSIPSDSLYTKLTKPTVYTYLNIDGTATVTKVVWLNVMYHNPAYKQLYEIVKKYYKRMYVYIQDTFLEDMKDKKSADLTVIKFNLTDEVDWEIDTNEYINQVNSVIDLIKNLNLNDNAMSTENSSIYNYSDQINMWKLYYMFKGMKKNSQEYNDFMEKYADMFINAKDKELQKMEDELKKKENELTAKEDEFTKESDATEKDNLKSKISELKYDIRKQKDQIFARKNRGYTNMSDEQRQASNEKRFKDSVQKELEFHFKYIEQLTEYMPLKRASLNTTVKQLFKDNVLNVQEFMDAMTNKNNKYCTTVDNIDDGKLYEIQVGISLVGGKVTPEVASKLRCKFDNYKWAKQYQEYNISAKLWQKYNIFNIFNIFAKHNIKVEDEDKTNELFMYPYLDMKSDIEQLQKEASSKPVVKAEAKPATTGGGGNTNGTFGKTNGATAYSGGGKKTRKRNKNIKRRFTRYNK